MWIKLQKKAFQNFDVEKLRLKYAETDARQDRKMNNYTTAVAR
jgi:hypothetical protein